MSQRWLNRRFGANTTDSVAQLRQDMTLTMEQGSGFYRTGEGLLHCQQQLQALQQRYQQLKVTDRSKVFNSELLQYLELGFGLDVALAICSAAMARTESRGAHQRLDSGMTARNDAEFLCHSQLYYKANSLPHLSWQAAQISSLPPAQRSYGADNATADNSADNTPGTQP
jgi:fumarate reductase flavoprotein subunit